MEKLESIYQELKIAPLTELTKKVLEEKLKLASDLWDKSDDPFDDQILHVYDQTICLIYILMESLSTQNHRSTVHTTSSSPQESSINPINKESDSNGTVHQIRKHIDGKSSDQAVIQGSTLESNNENIPFWSKLDSNVKEINFIKKPLNLQSNKPLCHIKINQPLMMASEPKAGKFKKFSSKASNTSIEFQWLHSIFKTQFQFNVLSTWWPIKRNRLDELFCRYAIKISSKIN